MCRKASGDGGEEEAHGERVEIEAAIEAIDEGGQIAEWYEDCRLEAAFKKTKKNLLFQ